MLQLCLTQNRRQLTHTKIWRSLMTGDSSRRDVRDRDKHRERDHDVIERVVPVPCGGRVRDRRFSALILG